MDDYLKMYQNLAIAVIKQACDDYRRNKLTDKGFEKFCKSNWCSCLLAVVGCEYIDGVELYRKLRKEKENGISAEERYNATKRVRLND